MARTLQKRGAKGEDAVASVLHNSAHASLTQRALCTAKQQLSSSLPNKPECSNPLLLGDT